MYAKTRIYLFDDNDHKFFGEGPLCLLRAIEETGSLHRAASSMHMAYTKALSMMHQAEESLGFPLTITKIGGVGGGGSQLTPEAKEFLHDYEQYREACFEANQRIYHEIFSKKS